MTKGGSRRTDGRQARWDQHNADRRRLIIDAAVDEIAAGEPGAEVHVQQIAQRAGLSRSVLYRHFADRADLDLAVQTQILDGVWQQLLPAVALEGTVLESIDRVVSTYVEWAATHPALHAFAQADLPGADVGPLEQGLLQIASRVTAVIDTAIELLHVDTGDELRRGIDPLVFGLVGLVFAGVRRWLATTGPDRISATGLVELLSTTIWHALAGHAAGFGVILERDQPLEDLLGTVGSVS